MAVTSNSGFQTNPERKEILNTIGGMLVDGGVSDKVYAVKPKKVDGKKKGCYGLTFEKNGQLWSLELTSRDTMTMDDFTVMGFFS